MKKELRWFVLVLVVFLSMGTTLGIWMSQNSSLQKERDFWSHATVRQLVAAEGRSPASLGRGNAQADVEWALYHGAKVLSETEKVVEGTGDSVIRTSLVEVPHFRYSVLRVVEQITKGGEGIERSVQRKQMVGDHLVVRLKKDSDLDKLKNWSKKSGYPVKKVLPQSGLVLVGFEGKVSGAFETALGQLLKQGFVDEVDPDWISLEGKGS